MAVNFKSWLHVTINLGGFEELSDRNSTKSVRCIRTRVLQRPFFRLTKRNLKSAKNSYLSILRRCEGPALELGERKRLAERGHARRVAQKELREGNLFRKRLNMTQ